MVIIDSVDYRPNLGFLFGERQVANFVREVLQKLPHFRRGRSLAAQFIQFLLRLKNGQTQSRSLLVQLAAAGLQPFGYCLSILKDGQQSNHLLVYFGQLCLQTLKPPLQSAHVLAFGRQTIYQALLYLLGVSGQTLPRFEHSILKCSGRN